MPAFPGLALLMLAGCGGASHDAAAPVAAAPRTAPTALAADARTGPLDAYVGRYVFEVVAGRRFLDQPLVRAAVRRAAGSAIPAARILDRNVTAVPIGRIGGRIAYWGCKPHQCGARNWTLMLAADGSDPAICYHDDALTPATVDAIDGRATPRSNECPAPSTDTARGPAGG